MSSSRKVLLAMTGGVVVMLLGFVTLTGISASLAWTEGGGYGSGSVICQSTPTTSDTGLLTPGASGATPSPSGTAPACVPASTVGAQVVALAKAMADALYVNPACGGHISYPDCYYTWYKAPGSTYPLGLPSFPQAVIQYGEQVCPGCSAWANGTYQCVSFVRGAYSQVYPMRLTANAFDLWATYTGQQGWQEIPAAAAPPGQRSMPMPGDVMIFKDTSIGHVAIVMSVVRPSSTMDGAITFSNSNSVSPYTTMPLLPDLTVDTSGWPGYTVWGYIRPAGAASASSTLASGRFSS
jgi:CHAP domain-containing protein